LVGFGRHDRKSRREVSSQCHFARSRNFFRWGAANETSGEAVGCRPKKAGFVGWIRGIKGVFYTAEEWGPLLLLSSRSRRHFPARGQGDEKKATKPSNRSGHTAHSKTTAAHRACAPKQNTYRKEEHARHTHHERTRSATKRHKKRGRNNASVFGAKTQLLRRNCDAVAEPPVHVGKSHVRRFEIKLARKKTSRCEHEGTRRRTRCVTARCTGAESNAAYKKRPPRAGANTGRVGFR